MAPIKQGEHFHGRLPADLLRRLDRQAERRMYSRNALIRLAVARALDEWEDESDRLDDEAMQGRT